MPVSNTRMSERPAAEPTSNASDVGTEPEAGGAHCSVTVLPTTDELSDAGAFGADVHPVFTATVISFDATLTSLKSTRVARTRTKYTPLGPPVTL